MYEDALTAIREHRRRALAPVLIALLACDDADTRRDAFQLLGAFTGKGFGFDPAGHARARRGAIAQWRAWWNDQVANRTAPGR